MTDKQKVNQCDGPWRPTAQRLAFILSTIPKHVEIRAVSINGQTGNIAIEVLHEGLELIHEFDQGKMENSN